MDKKLGVFICGGCGIGAALDTQKLAGVATKEYKAAVSEIEPFLCGAEGAGKIRKHLADGSVNTVVIAACSPRVKSEVFSFPDAPILERVNIREHVAWCQKPNDEDTQMMAEDYLRMGIVKAQKSEPIERLSDEISKKLLVVGGGITGMTAALEASNAGYEVVLVEREPQLGGAVAKLRESNGIAAKIQTVSYHPKIQVLTSSKIVKTEGQPGMFDVSVETAGVAATFRTGAIVMATGSKPYDATKLGHLGYGAVPGVISSVEFEQMAVAGSLARPSDGKPAEDVLFIQCAGSRDKDHLPYCSSACCLGTLRQTGYVRELNPKAKVYVVYKDMRTPGQNEKVYRDAQDHPLNFFTKGDVAGVAQGPNGKIAVMVNDTLLGESIVLHADLVVLATGLVPNSADGEAIRALEDAEAKLAKGESESQKADATKKIEELKGHKGTEILHLTYRQGPDLPVLRHGFPDSHFVCFPYETRRTGIFTAGAVRMPMDADRAAEDAMGAAMKAIQSVEMASRGRAVHPRAGDQSSPSFFLQRCTQCKRCTEECPFGAIDEDAKGTPKPNLYRCRRCGICMGACPERIVSFKNYSVDMIASMIKAIEVPEEDEEKPRVLVFMCENDAYPALDIAGMNRIQYDPSVRVIPLRCLGSMNLVWIADALSGGIDGIMIIGCQYGDDYQCHFVKGSELANRRLENVKETLQRLQLERERLELTQLSINESAKLPVLINNFMDRIREMGPNPYKGF
jgi:quinone-modifying oxidoreductase subunit QmoB